MQYAFDNCVLDTARYELRRAGVPVKLEKCLADLGRAEDRFCVAMSCLPANRHSYLVYPFKHVLTQEVTYQSLL